MLPHLEPEGVRSGHSLLGSRILIEHPLDLGEIDAFLDDTQLERIEAADGHVGERLKSTLSTVG